MNKHRFKSFFTLVFLIMMLTGLLLVVKNFMIELDYVFYGERIKTSIDRQDNERVFKYFHRNKWHQINNSKDESIAYVYYSPHFNKYFSNEPSTTLFIFRVIGIIFFILMSLRVIKLINKGKDLDSLFLYRSNITPKHPK